MKLAIVIAAALLAGCMATTQSGNITTGSRVYDAKYAADRGLHQAQAAECERQGRAVWAKTVGGTAWGMANNNPAGLAYEACVRKVAGK